MGTSKQMSIREELNEILLEYPVDIAEDVETYTVLLEELETYVNKVREEAVRENRTPENLEELSKEFKKKFGMPEFHGDYVEHGTTTNSVLEFFAPHLNSRNLLERFCEWVNNKVLQLQLGGDVIGLTGSRLEGWIDEFLESESKHE